MAPSPVTPTTPGRPARAACVARTGANVELFTVAASGMAMMSDIPLRVPVEPVGSVAVVRPWTAFNVSRTDGPTGALVSTSMGVSTPEGTPPPTRVWYASYADPDFARASTPVSPTLMCNAGDATNPNRTRARPAAAQRQRITPRPQALHP